MTSGYFPPDLKGFSIFFVGIKGTGMTALAELMHKRGASVSGSDTGEKFYTDSILARLSIAVVENFREENLPGEVDLVIHSSAYLPDKNPQLIRAIERGIPVIEYTEALGSLSAGVFACGISGVHGKTTTTALCGTILREMDLPVSVLAGSGVSSFGGSSVFVNGDRYFVAETCEYKRHFLKFHPDVVVLTSIEPDHLDYFKDINDITDAFVSYVLRLPDNGELIYCADDTGVMKAVETVKDLRPDIKLTGYGKNAEGPYRITEEKASDGLNRFRLKGFGTSFDVKIPGHHLVLDAAAAVAAAVSILEKSGTEISEEWEKKIARGLREFSGCKRRSEIIGRWNDIIIMDDYGHHPTEIRTTLEGLRQFYPDRRIIVDFMSHTYSRTAALLDEFSSSFTAADIVILHKIYSSAREKRGTVSGRDLYKRMLEKCPEVYYFEEVMDAEGFCLETLKEGDLFITMGAGDNWMLGRRLADIFEKADNQ